MELGVQEESVDDTNNPLLNILANNSSEEHHGTALPKISPEHVDKYVARVLSKVSLQDREVISQNICDITSSTTKASQETPPKQLQSIHVKARGKIKRSEVPI
jgi:hypothetical protein